LVCGLGLWSWSVVLVCGLGSGGRIRTSDLWVMSPTSCHCSTPRYAVLCDAARLAASRPVLLCCCACLLLSVAALGVRARGVPATASPPTGSPPQYSPALPRVTTGFGMGPGGSRALSATDTPHAPTHRRRQSVQSGLVRFVVVSAHLRTCAPAHLHAQAPRGPSPGGTCPSTPPRPPRSSLVRSRPGNTPSTIRTSPLQSVTSRPRLAYRPGRLPGVSRGRSPGGVSSWGGIPT